MSNLKAIRLKKELSQSELAKLMNTTSASISRYENEDQRLNIPLLRKFSEVLNVSIAELVGEMNQPTTKEISLINPTKEGKHSMFIDDKIPSCDFSEMGKSLFGFILENSDMSPTFKQGDTIICNRNLNNLNENGVLVFENANKETFIARSQYNPITGTVELTTDNPATSNYGSIDDQSKIKILGRMICSIQTA